MLIYNKENNIHLTQPIIYLFVKKTVYSLFEQPIRYDNRVSF